MLQYDPYRVGLAVKRFLQTFNASGIMLSFEKSQRDLRFVELDSSRSYDSVGVEHYGVSFRLTAMGKMLRSSYLSVTVGETHGKMAS